MVDHDSSDRPHIEKSVEELREIVEEVRQELKRRRSSAARALLEEIDPEYSRDRPEDCCVYVIELDDAVRQVEGFRNRNPAMRDDRACLYVGSTWRTPQERFKEHKNGRKASKLCREYGRRLRPEFFERYPDMTRAQAEEEERALATLLRREGYGIWQA